MFSIHFRRLILGWGGGGVGSCIIQEKNDPEYIATFDLQSPSFVLGMYVLVTAKNIKMKYFAI